MSDTREAGSDAIQTLIGRWRQDEGSTYRTWFLWDERLKNFRSISRGIFLVASEIEQGTFGNAYRGSSLETVVKSVAEQRQIFRGADHAFLWKPKLRIPDIYEDRDNQLAFGRFLATCSCCPSEGERVVEAIRTLDGKRIKGLGPAAANLLYFLHPTVVPPFNTAIVRGYNALTGSNVKLGSWDEYLAMRLGVLELNGRYSDLLSNDLGAIAGVLFDVGSQRYAAPPIGPDDRAREMWEQEIEKVRSESAQARRALDEERDNDRTHTEVQGWLRDLGCALGYRVWIAGNDRNRKYAGGRLCDGCLDRLPPLGDGSDADDIRLIDVLWFEPSGERIAAAFEVEHTTSIHSGIVRMLSPGMDRARQSLFLVAPDGRESEVREKLRHPAWQHVASDIRFIPYGELDKNREAIARFGQGLKPIEAIARHLL